MSACPFCAESVEDGDEKCRSCGEFLGEREPAEQQSGGALKAVLIVIAVLVVLGLGLCLVGSMFLGTRVKAAQGQAMQARVSSDMHVLKNASKIDWLDMGAYPKQLSDLWTSPGGTRWKGPYVARPNPLDPWGNPYVYVLQGKAPVFTSYGADGAPGGAGDAAYISSGP